MGNQPGALNKGRLRDEKSRRVRRYQILTRSTSTSISRTSNTVIQITSCGSLIIQTIAGRVAALFVISWQRLPALSCSIEATIPPARLIYTVCLCLCFYLNSFFDSNKLLIFFIYHLHIIYHKYLYFSGCVSVKAVQLYLIKFFLIIKVRLTDL